MEAADGNHLVFGEETTIESLKDTFTNSPHYSGIKFHCCPILPQEQFHDLIVTLRQDLNSLSISQSPWVDDETLEIFTAYCHKIKNLELTGCLSKVTRAGIESIGRNLGELQSLAINYTNNVKNDAIASDHSWTLDNCIFPALINNSSSQVQHFSLSGFQSITYDALRKFLDNFKSSLTSLDFSDLMIVDDAALGDIGKMCVNLVQIKVNNCSNISDEGLTVFSNHCSNLTCFESAGCDLLTDEGTKVLAEACSKLEKIRLDFCSKITESSLEYLATYCSSLKCIHCEKTGIKYVPVSIFKLQHLDKLCIDNCDSLRFPRASIVAKGLPAIKEVVIHTDISRRVKVVAVGCAQSGKTSLLMSIQSLSPNVADGETFGVPTHLWMPFRDCNGEVMASLTEAVGAEIVAMNSDLTTELWDCSGRKALQGVHPLLFSGRAIYLLPFNVGLYNSEDKIPQWISAIQAKTPGAYIILVASHTDLGDKESCQSLSTKVQGKVKEMEQTHIEEIKNELDIINELEVTGLLASRKNKLEFILKTRIQVHPQVIEVSSISGQGCIELCQLILEKAMDSSMFPAINISPEIQYLYFEIMNLREDGIILQSRTKFLEMARSVGIEDEATIKTAINQLQELGCILYFRFPNLPFGKMEDIVCIDPGSLSNAVACIHRNEENPQELVNVLIKGNHLDPLWPAAKPNDWTLRGAFNNITSNGMIRETIIPLLLHPWPLEEEQAQMILSVMELLVVLVSGAPNASYDVELILAGFKNLSVYKRYFLPMQGKLPVIPQVNAWLPNCPSTHLQIGWSYHFASDIPQSLLLVLISATTTAQKGSETLSYWQNGTYIRVGDVDVAVLKNKEETGLDVLARSKIVNGTRQALNMGWCILSRFLYIIECILASYEGLFYAVSVTNMQTTQSKSLEEIIDSYNKKEISVDEALWVLPLVALEGNDEAHPSLPDNQLDWLVEISGRCLVYIHHDSSRCGEMKSIGYFFQNAGLVSVCDSDIKEELRQQYLNTAAIVILILSAKYIDEQKPNDIIPFQEKGKALVLAVIEELSHTDQAITDSIFHGLPKIDLTGGTGSGAGYQVNRDQVRALIEHCHKMAFGSGDVLIKQEEPEQCGGGMEADDDSSDDEFDNDRGKVSWGGKVVHSSPVSDKPKKKRSVQFADSDESMDEDTEIRKVAASAVAAAVAAATAEHIAKQSNPTMGAKAAAMAAKVADAVAKGDSDGASKAVIATAKAVDEVVAVASQRASVTRTNGTVNSTEKGKVQSPSPPKSSTCVLL